MGSRPGSAIPKVFKMVLVAPLLTLALKGSARKIKSGKYPTIRYLLCRKMLSV